MNIPFYSIWRCWSGQHDWRVLLSTCYACDGASNRAGTGNGRSSQWQTPNGCVLIILAVLLVVLGIYPTLLIELITAVLRG